jgi:hypothetical protein
LTSLWEDVKETGNVEQLADWPEDAIPHLDTGLKNLVSRMTNLDPESEHPFLTYSKIPIGTSSTRHSRG